MNERHTTPCTSLPGTLGEAIADDLRRRILTHELAAGSRIDAARWAGHYGVEKARMLEAFKLLKHDQLLSSVAANHATVAVASDDELREAKALHALLTSGARGDAARPRGSWHEAILAMVERRLQLGKSLIDPATGTVR